MSDNEKGTAKPKEVKKGKNIKHESKYGDPNACNYCDGIGKKGTVICPICGGSGAARIPPLSNII